MDVIKDTEEQGDGRDAQGKVCEERHQASIPSLGGPLSQHLHRFTHLEALIFGEFLQRLQHLGLIDH